MNFNGIGFMIATFVHATTLARGVDDLHGSAATDVPVEDMRAARDYGKVLHTQVDEIVRQASTIHWPATARTLTADVFGGALDATRRLARSAEEVLFRVDNGRVPALRGGLITHGVQQMTLARELLEVATGERSLAESMLHKMDQAIADQALKMVPLIGECVMAFEAVAGRRLVEPTQRLTPAERAISGAAILLPHALGYVGGRIGSTVSKATLVTRRAIRLACESAKVFQLLDSELSVRLFTQLAVSLRTISESEFKEFVELLVMELGHQTFTSAQRVRLNYFIYRMSTRARQALWLRIIDKELGSALKGVQLLKATRPKPGEVEILTRFNRVTNKPVVLLPELSPAQYPSGSQVQGALHPDGMLDNELFDLITSNKNNTLDDVLNSFVRKDRQVTKVLMALTESHVGIEEVSLRISEVWANPRILNIDTVILFDGLRVVTHTRPNLYVPPFAMEIMRLVSSNAGRLINEVRQVEMQPL